LWCRNIVIFLSRLFILVTSCTRFCKLLSSLWAYFHHYSCLPWLQSLSSEKLKKKKPKNYSLLHQRKINAYFHKKHNRHLPSLGLTFLNLSFHTFQILFFQLFSEIHFGETTKRKRENSRVSHPPYKYKSSSTLFRFPHLIFSMSTHQLTF
jgi:hypothetical protein